MGKYEEKLYLEYLLKNSSWENRRYDISTMKYVNGPVNEWIGPQISPSMRSRNVSGLAFI